MRAYFSLDQASCRHTWRGYTANVFLNMHLLCLRPRSGESIIKKSTGVCPSVGSRASSFYYWLYVDYGMAVNSRYAR